MTSATAVAIKVTIAAVPEYLTSCISKFTELPHLRRAFVRWSTSTVSSSSSSSASSSSD
eukprot:CAMPEP_0194492686 /NCGR_PEP_ID=MMETSP0253-20130528/11160_1 /TAXON_ID=2966 /ORGANISM="Noctiluca scintillans" /LENGTH=58 /DNA_ID=CAMNT_0039333587 /DNA_START=44 /DNA_END=217 /DNA_ORIENTATION=+